MFHQIFRSLESYVSKFIFPKYVLTLLKLQNKEFTLAVSNFL